VTGTVAAGAAVWSCALMRWYEPPDQPWTPCRALLAPGSPQLDGQLRLVAERQAVRRPSVGVSLFLERYAWAAATAAFTCLLGEGGLPDLDAANVAVHADDEGFVDALRLLDPRLRPASAAGPGLDRLRRGLLDGHLLPLVDVLLERRPHRGRSALRCLVADALVAGAAGAAEVTGRPAAEAARLAMAVCDLLGTPAALRPRVLDAGGLLVRRRGVCCLLHTEAGAHCSTCPHLSDAETVRRTRQLRGG
jgi:hypothetical protein